ncbi:MAG: KH domain-containing protein [Gloeocapsa sp. UFS-A4-WI-NPMV-4B04]|jgi:hypothetical protein|nr:KH domain-containing protein [Gloeocapsa sp. UFS-A4-WI-NPMV-4B04]
MFLNKSVPQSPSNVTSNQKNQNIDYAKLVRFLIEPFLESADSLSVDCEVSHNTARVWIRIAFEGEDKGRVFGRGGRNIQAIRTVIAAAASLAGHSVYLDIYGSAAFNALSSAEEAEVTTKPKERREGVPKPLPKPRSRSSSE